MNFIKFYSIVFNFQGNNMIIVVVRNIYMNDF